MKYRYLDNRLFSGVIRGVRASLLLLLLAAGASQASAVESADSVVTVEDVPLTAIDNNGENAVISLSTEQLQLQKRFKPRQDDYKFPQAKWRRFFVNAGAGANWINDNFSVQHQSAVNIGLGYRFTPVHTLRASMDIVNYRLASTNAGASAVGGTLDYMMNLTNFAGGYDPDRYVDVYYILGVGALSGSKGEGMGRMTSPFGRTAFQMDVNITKNVGLFVEPYVGIQKSMTHVLGNENPERWDLMYGVRGGLSISFEDFSNVFAKSDTIRRKFFFDTSVGWTTPSFSDFKAKSGIGYSAAFGKWLNPMLGVRWGLQAQSFIYSNEAYNLYGTQVDLRREQALLSGRAELMVDIPNAFPKWRDVPAGHNFDMNLLAGAEYGWTRRSHQPGDVLDPGFNRRYYGFTGALQLMYRINNPGTYIFVEPRYLAAFYTNKYTTKSDRADMYSLSVGTRIYISDYSMRRKPAIPNYQHWWMAADIGGMKWQRSIFFKNGTKVAGLNPSASLSVGYDLCRLASFRAQVNYQRLFLTSTDTWSENKNSGNWGWGGADHAYDVMDLRLAYMMNLNNLLQGYRPGRRYGLWWTVGPTFSYIFNEKSDWVSGLNRDGAPQSEPTNKYSWTNSHKGKVSPGIATSLMAILALNNKLDLTVEALGQYNFIKGTNPGVMDENPRLNNVKYGLTIGTRYHFVPGQLKVGGVDASRYFFDSSVGWTSPTLGSDIMHKSGITYQAGFGRWFHPVFALKVGVAAQSFLYNREATTINGADVSLNREQVLLTGRVEALIDPLNFVTNWRNNKDHRFDLNIGVGADYGWNRRSHLPGDDEVPGFHKDYFGLTASAMLLYRVNNPGTYIFVEPRFLTARYKDRFFFHDSYKTYDNTYSMSIGTRIYMQNRTIRHAAKDSLQAHWWTAFEVGGQKWQRSIFFRHGGGIGLNPEVTFSLGYDWKKFASFRAQLSYQHLTLSTNTYYSGYTETSQQVFNYGLWDNKYSVMDLRLAYMLNLNNLFQGYRADRRYNLWWTAGPSLTYIFYEKNKWADDQNCEVSQLRNLTVGERHQGNISPGVATSILASLRVAPQMDVTVEALGQYNFKYGTNPGIRGKINNVKYSVGVGMRYHLQEGQLRHTTGEGRRFFFDSSIGWTTPTFKSGFMHQAGNTYQMAFGQWLHPLFGLRIGAAGQSYIYSNKLANVGDSKMTVAKEEVLLSGRLEAVFAPLNLFEGWREKVGGHDFDLNLSAGGELGWLRRSHNDVAESVPSFRTSYKGITTSAQLMYRVNGGGTYVFLEPRYVRTHFNNSAEIGGEKDRTNTYSLSLGTRVYLAQSETRHDNDEYERGLWAGLSIGNMKWQRSMYLKSGHGLGMNPSLAVSVGYDLCKWASFRAVLNYQQLNYNCESYYEGQTKTGGTIYGYGVWNNDYHVADLRLNYMLNVNNMFQGYKADRKFNLWWTVGPAVTYIFHEKKSWNTKQTESRPDLDNITTEDSRQGKVSPAVYTSLMAQLRVAKKWDVTCECGGQYNFIFGTDPGFKSRINNVKYDFNLGTRYYF